VAKERILIVDDEKGVRSSLQAVLSDEGFETHLAKSGEECLEMVTRTSFDAILLDVWLPKMDGLDVLQELRRRNCPGAVIMISGHGTIETAVKATKLGAFDFIEKPLSLEKTVLVVKNALKQARLEQENRWLREQVSERFTLIGESEPVQRLRAEIALAAPTAGRVLIYGENGTGKELVARLIHQLSDREPKPFVEMNCAAVPEELIESELFGHEKGSFTGAVESKRGRFELADEGTLFLDEIGDMSLRMQAKVLRVLQEQKFQSVGGAKTISVNVRVIAATNKDLQKEIQKASFREDLFFRLNVIPLHLPPLRERAADVPLLVAHFIEQLAREYGRRPKRLTPSALDSLSSYHWPGNVRELKNIVERILIMVPQEVVDVGDLPSVLRNKEAGGRPARDEAASLREAREEFERQFILKKLEELGWNITRTADALGLERSNLHRKLKAFGITVERKAERGAEASS